MYQKHRFLFRFLLALLLFGFNGIVASRILLESSQIVLLRTRSEERRVGKECRL